jgi:hypothetical protein
MGIEAVVIIAVWKRRIAYTNAACSPMQLLKSNGA